MRKVFIDCPECIPCNPCEYACPAGAIRVGEQITDQPQVDLQRCTGCGLCVAACPGQACFLVDPEFGPGEASVDFPFEYLPLPQPGDTVEARDNMGQTVCSGRVVRVHPGAGSTYVVRIAVPSEFAYQVRGIRPLAL